MAHGQLEPPSALARWNGDGFGRSFLYDSANPFAQVILLAKAAGRSVKLIWSREEEFLCDALRPMGLVR